MMGVFLAVLLTIDGGMALDAPFSDVDAGVFAVTEAKKPDGGMLGPGWWLSGPRMLRTGARLTELQNQNAKLKAETIESKSTFGFWSGVLTGLVVGLGALVYVVTTVKK